MDVLRVGAATDPVDVFRDLGLLHAPTRNALAAAWDEWQRSRG
jgi:hypothetical protein